MDAQFDFLDVLTLLSFILQVQNQTSIISINDVQKEVDRAIKEIHSHLENQDEKINRILEVIENDKDQEIR